MPGSGNFHHHHAGSSRSRTTASRRQRQRPRVIVSGQVEAGSEQCIPGFPREDELSQAIVEPPEEIGYKRLASSFTDGACDASNDSSSLLEPAIETNQVVKFSFSPSPPKALLDAMLQRCCRKCSITMPLKDANGQAYGNGAYIKLQRNLLGLPTFIVHDANDKPLALCKQDGNHGILGGKRAYTIYGTSPVVPLDKEVTRHNCEGVAVNFYPWLRVRDMNYGRLPYYPIYVWDGKSYNPILRAIPSESQKVGKCFISACHPTRKRREFLILDPETSVPHGYMSERHQQGSLCGCNRRKAVAAQVGWNVTIAPGVDPVLMACLAAAVSGLPRPKYTSMPLTRERLLEIIQSLRVL